MCSNNCINRFFTALISDRYGWSFILTLLFIPAFASELDGVQDVTNEEVIEYIKDDANKRVRDVELEFKRLSRKSLPKGYEQCRWNDVKETKKMMPFYMSAYERAIDSCKNRWAPSTQTLWLGLDHAKKSTNANDYPAAIEFLRGSRYQESAKTSAVRDLTDLVIRLFEAGKSQTYIMKESYLACVNWAERDPDQIMSGRKYEPLTKAEHAIARGLLVCD